VGLPAPPLHPPGVLVLPELGKLPAAVRPRPGSTLLDEDKPRGAYFWARRWRCNHGTARKVLAHLHRTLGSRVVWRVGPQRALMTTEAALRVVSVLRNGKYMIVVEKRASAPGVSATRARDDEDDLVTVEHLQRVVGQLRREIAELRKR
jgi:hypothetical protein